MSFRFRDRRQAGQILAEKLEQHASDPRVIVLALPRGGVPVGYEVAQRLGASLDVFLVRKLGVPGQEELAMGAIATGGYRTVNNDVIDNLQIPPRVLEEVTARETEELLRREMEYGVYEHPWRLRERLVILVDDGLATGATMRAAVMAAGEQGPAWIIVAAPVGARDTCAQLETVADEVVCAQRPWHFRGVGEWYEDFTQTTDGEVRDLLEKAARPANFAHAGAEGNDSIL